MTASAVGVAQFFDSVGFEKIELANRIVMPPMGIHKRPDGVPDAKVADYYRQRAEGGVGLIIVEGTAIDHEKAAYNPTLLNFATQPALDAWGEIARQVRGAGAKIIPQLWHAGLMNPEEVLAGGEFHHDPARGLMGPSGMITPGRKVAPDMTQADIDSIIDAFARGAVEARRLGFDGVEVHGAHGYLLDQFFWEPLNQRLDGYGGSRRNRSRFAAEVIAEIRRRTGPGFPIVLRISQWKLHDYDAKVAHNPVELEEWLLPLVDAGVDMFDCSQRRYWESEFEGSSLNLSGWVRKVTGKPTITVGSVGLTRDVTESFAGAGSEATEGLDRLVHMFADHQFDLIAVGRGHIADPDWCNKVRNGDAADLIPFSLSMLVC